MGLSTMYGGDFSSGREHEYNQVSAKFVQQILIVKAEELFEKLH